MAIVTKNSLFYHVGKTGGHSVRHMLWRANLVETQITPIHIRPTEFHNLYPEIINKFTFCFVRHPLEWLASVWTHNMSYGSTDPTMPDENTFTRFLEAVSEMHRAGAVTERLQEYVDACQFVGRLENLHADLLHALNEAGEDVDPTTLVPVRLNEGVVQALKKAARAPKTLLNHLLEKDSAFARRFGYDKVPQHMISDLTRLNIPTLVLAHRETRPSPAKENKGAVFDHPVWLSNGSETSAQTKLRRYSWQVWIALTSIADRGSNRFAAFLDEDGTNGHMAAGLGFAEVTSIAIEHRRSADLLDEILETNVRRRPFDALPALRKQFDTVLHPTFSEARSPTIALSMLASLLRPRGVILIRVELLQDVDKPIAIPVTPMQSPVGPLTTVLMSQAALEALLVGAGFIEVKIIDSFMNKPPPEQVTNAAKIAQQFDLDPQNLTVTALVSAKYDPISDVMEPTAAALEDAWLFARSLWVSDPANVAEDAPLRRLVDQQRVSLTSIEAERAYMRGALADREADLAQARQQLHATLIALEEVRLERHILEGALSDREGDLARERAELVELRAEKARRN